MVKSRPRVMASSLDAGMLDHLARSRYKDAESLSFSLLPIQDHIAVPYAFARLHLGLPQTGQGCLGMQADLVGCSNGKTVCIPRTLRLLGALIIVRHEQQGLHWAAVHQSVQRYIGTRVLDVHARYSLTRFQIGSARFRIFPRTLCSPNQQL